MYTYIYIYICIHKEIYTYMYNIHVLPGPRWHWIPCLGGRSARPILERIDFAVDHVLAKVGSGDDTIGNPRRAQISQFELFELIFLLKLDSSLSSDSRQQHLSQQYPPPLLQGRRGRDPLALLHPRGLCRRHALEPGGRHEGMTIVVVVVVVVV